MLMLLAFTLGDFFVPSFPFLLLQSTALQVSLRLKAFTCEGQGNHKQPSSATVCYLRAVLRIYVACTNLQIDQDKQSPLTQVYAQPYAAVTKSESLCSTWTIGLTLRLLRSSSDSELLSESELLLSKSLRSEDRSSLSPWTTGRVGIRGVSSADAAAVPSADPGILKFADR